MLTRIKFNMKLLHQGAIHMHIASNWSNISLNQGLNFLLIVQKLAVLIMFRNLTIDRCFVVNGTDIAMAKITKRESIRWQYCGIICMHLKYTR